MPWWQLCHGGNYAMVATMPWWQLCHGGNYATVATMPRWQIRKGSCTNKHFGIVMYRLRNKLVCLLKSVCFVQAIEGD